PYPPCLFSIIARPPSPTLFPYPTLFRSRLHFFAGHRFGIVLVHREWRDRHARGEQVVELPEELAEQVPDPAASSSGSTTTCSPRDRKSTRLNSSHRTISYAVFCLKKKNS